MELPKRFKQGDVDAFEALFRQFQAEVYGWIVQIVRDPGIAEGLTIETFWRIHKARARFDTEASFGAWARRQNADQFLPDPPPSLQSSDWVEAFNQIKTYGEVTSSMRTSEQTAIAKFWSANVVRQYNLVVRDIVDQRTLGLLQTARLTAMVNTVGADALISCLFAKYHYLFWRPVTAIDPTAVTFDGFGPIPGYDDGNLATVEQLGWRPLLVTPNHPEYPAAHGSITSAMAEVFSSFLGAQRFNLDIHGFDAAGAAGNLNAVRHFEMANDLRNEIIYARLWAGLHYHFSSVAGVVLGRNVAKYDLRHAFRPLN